ncbi:MAG: sigma-70 family RNA polymerase sigma factor [Streptosporangiaceae bacterium]
MLDHSPEAWPYEELYVEHAPAARRLALSLVPADVADDIVAEAFARVLAAIRAGGGPRHAFRGYLLTAVRHLAHDWLQARRRLTVVGDLDVQATEEAAGPGRVSPGIGAAAETQAAARDEARLVTRAFGRLPARWREVLWQLEVEGKAPAAVAPMFGLSANGVSALAMRAREGLRQAYLEEHVGANIPAACRAYAAEFGAGARGRLSQRRRAAMQEHLGHCPACQDLFAELTELNSRLGTILTPVALAAAARALGSAKRATALRAHLAGNWRTWRWHPVTSVTGAAAGVAVVGGMLLAVNVTPVTSPPAHPATALAIPANAPRGSAPRTRHPAGGSGGPVTHAAAHSPASPGSPASAGALAAATPPSGAASGAQPNGPVPASPSQTSQPSSDGGNPATSTPANPGQAIATTAGNTVTGLTNTVTSLTNTASNTVTGLVNTAGATVAGVTTAASGLASTATNTVTRATSNVTGAVTGIANATGATVATTGKTVSNAASTAASAVSGAASTAAGAVSGAASTVTGAVSGAASTATGATSTVTGAVTATEPRTTSAASGPASTAAGAATSTARTVVTAVTGVVGAGTGSL